MDCLRKKPNRNKFSSGPCEKPPRWGVPACSTVGRSHRSIECMQLISEVIRLQKKILQIPDDYLLGVVSASSSGAMETLLWNLIGARGVDSIAHCVFSEHWTHDIVNELKAPDVRVFRADFPTMADVTHVDFDRDVVLCLCSTTSGVAFQNTDWIPEQRQGLTICDAASAVFCMDIDWNKIDAAAFSWQKGLGGEAGFGSIVLSPRAVERLESYQPDRAIPRVFRIVEGQHVNRRIFDGFTINTPSMMCIEDFHNSLQWADSNGGMRFLLDRVNNNNRAIAKWIEQQTDFQYLVDSKYRAQHIASLDVAADCYQVMYEAEKWKFLRSIVSICEEEQVGFDFLGHIWTKPHLRIWCGPTVESSDLSYFLPWLEYAYEQVIKCN